MFEKTKKFCDSFLEMGVPGFDIAVYKGGDCMLRYMNGYSDIENIVKMQGVMIQRKPAARRIRRGMRK